MQWDGGLNAGFSDVPPERLYAPPIDDERFGCHRVNVAAQRADPESLWHALRRMMAIRKTHLAFSRGSCDFVPLKNRAVLAIVRAYEGETILAVHNLSALPQKVWPGLRRWQGAQVYELLSGREFPAVTAKPYAIRLRPYEYLWFKLGRSEEAAQT
jgi:maltose alpha-D-glucosyltransferase/alpha-amylase